MWVIVTNINVLSVSGCDLGHFTFFFQDTLSEQTNKTIQMDLVFHGSSVGQPLETISVKILIFSYNA